MAAEKSQLKVKKKTWFQVFTNPTFGETFIGEIPLDIADTLPGRHIQTNLMNLTGNPRNQNINLKFRVDKVVGAKGIAYPISYSIVASSIRRTVRRKKDKIDDAFACTTADGIQVVFKPMLVTKSQSNNSVHHALRKEARAFLFQLAQGSNYFSLFSDVINFRVQKALRDHLKRIYPLAICEIRVLEAVKGQLLVNASEEAKRPVEMLERKPIEKKQPAEAAAEEPAGDGKPKAGPASAVQPGSENAAA